MPTDPPTNAEAEAREGLMETLWHGNAPGIDYYGPNDERWNAAANLCKSENAAELAAFESAVRAAERARLRGLVEGMRVPRAEKDETLVIVDERGFFKRDGFDRFVAHQTAWANNRAIREILTLLDGDSK